MEELQDAIEDAQYINAMNDDSPKPSKEWTMPPEEMLLNYIERVRACNPDHMTLRHICSTPLGFYLFLRFVREAGDGAFSCFLMEASIYRTSPAFRRLDIAVQIADAYLLPRGRGVERQFTEDCVVRAVPDMEGIKWKEFLSIPEPDAAPKPDENSIRVTGKPVADALELLKKQNVLSPTQSPNGSIADEERDEQPNRQSRRKKKESGKDKAKPSSKSSYQPPANLFDTLDHIVFEYLQQKHFHRFKSSDFYMKYHGFMCLAENSLTEDDFSLFRVLGRGGFGLVNGCKKCTSGKLFAMKVMDKRRIKMKKSETLCVNERNILAMVDSPFIVNLKYAFSTNTELFLILDLMTGGDLGYLLHRMGRLAIDHARFYAARTLLGIAALHERHIVYRDLKPDNILLDDQGYSRVSDLGLSCRVPSSGLTGACGTRGYWAPEMIRRDDNGNRIRYFLSVDWFSFGCMLYEFIHGISPFRTETARKWGGREKADRDKAIDQATIEMEPEFDSDSFDAEAQDICSKLLCKDPEHRLGANGPQEIMDHPFFSNYINWTDFKYGVTPPPMVPPKDLNMASQSEIGMFNDDKVSKKIDLEEKDHEVFDSWDFVNKKAFQEEVVGFMRYEEIHGPVKIIPQSNGCCTIM